MDFTELWMESTYVKAASSADFDPRSLIPVVYAPQGDPAFSGSCMQVMAGGRVVQQYAFTINVEMPGYYLLLYTAEGLGICSGRGASLRLADGSLLLADLGYALTLSSAETPWKFSLFFLAPGASSFLCGAIDLPVPKVFPVPAYSPLLHDMQTILEVRVPLDEAGQLTVHSSLTSIFCALARASLSAPGQKETASGSTGYLDGLVNYLDCHIEEPFSLDHCESLTGVSKYRLCREFTARFGLPPLHYVNEKRMKKAKEMLLTTDLSIREISSSVGFDNTSHFISLFRRRMGVTPGIFKQKAQESRSSLHSVSQ
ncbi:MAG: AraC family transcriptional regulator [Lachnospiraceae bacterium]|jgi:AraC-like DNA-binding protein|nr:AraC family transcriptional regulator [Lachnospiraceae bacterium]